VVKHLGMTASTKRDRYLPWRRAGQLVGSALYWIPISAFPCRAEEKRWLRQFLVAFDKEMGGTPQCRVEVFVHRNAIYPDMTEPMLLNLRALNPVPGVMRVYGESLRKAPAPREIVRMVNEGRVETLLSLGTDIGWWFAQKNADKQRDLFLGLGGMVNVWVPPDPKTAPPSFHMPEKVLKNPAFAGLDIAGAILVTYSFADSFLPNSLKTFAPELKADPQYQGYPFALALFKSQDILSASGEQREEWLSLARCYLIESPSDKGILLWGTLEIDGAFDKALEVVRQQKLEYPIE
jgi:hypothetical protein